MTIPKSESRYGYPIAEITDTYTFEKVDLKNHNCHKLAGYTPLVRFIITSDEYKGFYLVELLQGLYHPYCIVPESDIEFGPRF